MCVCVCALVDMCTDNIALKCQSERGRRRNWPSSGGGIGAVVKWIYIGKRLGTRIDRHSRGSTERTREAKVSRSSSELCLYDNKVVTCSRLCAITFAWKGFEHNPPGVYTYFSTQLSITQISVSTPSTHYFSKRRYCSARLWWLMLFSHRRH